MLSQELANALLRTAGFILAGVVKEYDEQCCDGVPFASVEIDSVIARAAANLLPQIPGFDNPYVLKDLKFEMTLMETVEISHAPDKLDPSNSNQVSGNQASALELENSLPEPDCTDAPGMIHFHST